MKIAVCAGLFINPPCLNLPLLFAFLTMLNCKVPMRSMESSKWQVFKDNTKTGLCDLAIAARSIGLKSAQNKERIPLSNVLKIP